MWWAASSLPALLQSIEKLLLWPTKALLRPGPRLDTLLASESLAQGAALWLDALAAGSNVRVDVSLPFVTLTSREPERRKKKIRYNHLIRCLDAFHTSIPHVKARLLSPVTLALKGLPPM